MLNAVVIGIHLLASAFLILFVLLHSGKGGGLSDMFGGGSMSTMSGSTVVERNLDRLTVAAGVVFAVTTMLLALLLA